LAEQALRRGARQRQERYKREGARARVPRLRPAASGAPTYCRVGGRRAQRGRGVTVAGAGSDTRGVDDVSAH
jgi:hypothetical protein